MNTPESREAREEREYRDAVAEIATRLHEVNCAFDAQRLLAALNAMRDEGGCITPAEAFILSVLGTYYFHGLTPEDVERDLETFREDFEEVIKTARFLRVRYPKVFEEKVCAATPEK